jgi:cob(I)alamin adenosyltransferase
MKGLTHVYTGDGKGKTTAALGLALRAAGCGRRVLIVQFLKGRESGEVRALAFLPNITLLRLDRDYGFYKTMPEEDRKLVRERHDRLLSEAVDRALAGDCDLLLLDELIPAYRYGAVDRERVDFFLENKPEGLELVLTGRDAPSELLERADYITEMQKRRHPFDRGITAREGIEY